VAAAGSVAPDAAPAVADAWRTVGVLTEEPRTGPAPQPVPDGAVVVTRSGGFAGLRQSGEVRLGEDPRTDEVLGLLSGIDPHRLQASRPQPDRYVYAFRFSGQEIVVNEQDLTPELYRLARLVLPE
jgi:hypothetical protein